MSIDKFKTPESNASNPNSPAPSIKLSQHKPKEKREKKLGETSLYNGELVPKLDKIVSALGTIEELLAFLGIFKAEHLNPVTETKFEVSSSAKLFISARITQIQEALVDIMASLGTSHKVLPRYDKTRFTHGEQLAQELEEDMQQMTTEMVTLKQTEHPLLLIPGTSVVESYLMYARTLCRRAERQVNAAKNQQLGMVPEDNIIIFLNKLGDYLLALALHTLDLESKEPMKRIIKIKK